MAIEEITLTPVEVVKERLPSKTVSPPPADNGSESTFARRYRQLLEERNRFSWTQRGRQRREEKFGVACRTLAKKLAQQCADPLVNRDSRQRVRTAVYASIVGLMDEASRDHRLRTQRSATMLRVAFVLAVIGLGGLIFSLAGLVA